MTMSTAELIATIAELNMGGTEWEDKVARVAKRNIKVIFPVGAPKCNLFVYEVILAAGAIAPTYPSGGSDRRR